MRRDARTPAPGWLVAGAVVLLGSLWLRWFTAELSDIVVPGKRTAWDWFGLLDLYLVAVALLAVATAALAARGAPALREAAVLEVVLCGLGFLVVAYRVVSPPDDARPGFVTEVSVSAGPWLALASLGVLGLAAATLVGAERSPAASS